MKKIMPLLLLPLMCLTACGKTELTGTYSFTMGKDQETHIGLYVTLSKEDYVVTDSVTKAQTIKGKKLGLRLDTPEGQDIGGLGLISQILTENVTTYYNVNRDIMQNDMNKIDVAADVRLSETAEPVNIPSQVFNYGFIVFADGKKLTATLPVSMNDLKIQLCWYGYYIDLGNFKFETLDEKKLPGETGEARIGTHPIVDKEKKIDEVAEMNNNFAYTFSNTQIKLVEGETLTDYGYMVTEEWWPNNDQSEEPEIVCFVKGLDNKPKAVDNKKVSINGVKFMLTSDANGKITNFTDTSSQKVNPYNVYSEPFTFRDYHALSISLLKE